MIRQLNNDADLEIIQAIAYATWPVAYGSILPASQIDYMLSKFFSLETLKSQKESGYLYFILYLEHKPIGFYALHPINDTSIKLDKLYIDTAYKGRQLGYQMMQDALVRARQLRYKVCTLNVNRHNSAILFYAKCGFKITDIGNINIGNNYEMNDYIMEKVLDEI